MNPTPEMIEAAKVIIEQIAKAMESVTEGPWDTRQDRDDFEVYPTFEGPPSIGEWTSIATCHGIYDEVEANAAYIALCNPANMRVLLSAFEALALLPGDPVAWVREGFLEQLHNDGGHSGIQTVLWLDEENAGKRHSKRIPLYAAPAPLPVAVKDEWFGKVVNFFVQRGMLDERDEYDLDDVMSALSDNYDPNSSEDAVKLLKWREHPNSFPSPTWSAQTPFGFYNIEEISASDSPAYEVRLHAHHFVSVKDGLEEAKAAAQQDYETRIRTALSSPVGGTEEVKELQEQLRAAKWANERDRSTVCDQVNIIKDEIARRSWLCSSRGSYEWDDERYQQEFSAALEIIGKAVDKLSSIASDWSHCPETDAEIQAARAFSPTPASDIAALREENEAQRVEIETARTFESLWKNHRDELLQQNEELIDELAATYEELINHNGDDLNDTRARRVSELRSLQHVAKGERG